MSQITNRLNATSATDKALYEGNKNKDTANKNEQSSFGKAFSTDFVTLSRLRSTADANWKTILKADTALKDEWARVKEQIKTLKTDQARTVLSGLVNAMMPFEKTIAATQQAMKTKEGEKDAQWKKFKAAVKAKNKRAAGTALKKILTLKQQIITEQGKMNTAKQEILKKLKGKKFTTAPVSTTQGDEKENKG